MHLRSAANTFFVYLEPRERVWWLQVSYFCQQSPNIEANVVVSDVLYVTVYMSPKFHVNTFYIYLGLFKHPKRPTRYGIGRCC